MWFGTIKFDEAINMYYIEIHKNSNHVISAEYNIPADIVIFNRESFIDGELIDISIGMTIDELLTTAERVNYWKAQKKLGIEPPKSEMKHRETTSYIEEMNQTA